MSGASGEKIFSKVPLPMTTGIGSLPHHNIDAALEYSFRWKIPFLPQMPIRNENEYMIQQTISGLPGLVVRSRGEVAIDAAKWERESGAFSKRLEQAFRSTSEDAFQEFEPTADIYSCWGPFQWELKERGAKLAKIQLAGPMTSQWALRLMDGTPADTNVELATQIFRLGLAKSIAMGRRLRAAGIAVLLYIDEPGFYCFSRRLPRHLLGLEELRLFLQTLRKEGFLVGLHCCSNTDWSSVLGLELDVLSIDTGLSLPGLLDEAEGLRSFLARGARLSLGVVPTAEGGRELGAFRSKDVAKGILQQFSAVGFSAEETKAIVSNAIYTPACGLALHKTADAEKIYDMVLATAEDCLS